MFTRFYNDFVCVVARFSSDILCDVTHFSSHFRLNSAAKVLFFYDIRKSLGKNFYKNRCFSPISIGV